MKGSGEWSDVFVVPDVRASCQSYSVLRTRNVLVQIGITGRIFSRNTERETLAATRSTSYGTIVAYIASFAIAKRTTDERDNLGLRYLYVFEKTGYAESFFEMNFVGLAGLSFIFTDRWLLC